LDHVHVNGEGLFPDQFQNGRITGSQAPNQSFGRFLDSDFALRIFGRLAILYFQKLGVKVLLLAKAFFLHLRNCLFR